MPKHRHLSAAIAAIALLSTATQAQAARPDRQYLVGYAEAVLHQVLGLPGTRADVAKTTVNVSGELSDGDKARVRARLILIEGIEKVAFPPTAVEKWTRRLLFTPPIADVRAPRFAAAWQSYRGNNSLTNVGAVSFGETLTLADFTGSDIERDDIHQGNYELNFQGAVFSIFDLDGTSKDLVNSDFWAAITGSYRQRYELGDVSGMLRLFHQSSHLGDEYILFNAVSERDRVNVSYEGVDLAAAFEPEAYDGLRVYGGGSVLLRREPTTLDRWSAKLGGEYIWSEVRWPGTKVPGFDWPENGFHFYPVAAAHFQAYGQNDWQPDVSLAAGVQFRDRKTDDRQVRLLLSYFNGYSPNGQFYDEQLEYVSFGGQYQF